MSAVEPVVNNWWLEDLKPSAQSSRIDDYDLRDILRQVSELPIGVPDSQFAHVRCRLLDNYLFKNLTSQNKTHGSDSEWESRVQKRRTTLEPFVGHFLVCIFIRFPGCQYTIEVDPVARSVVHWEWKPA